MSLWILVELIEQGAVSEDDGETAWQSTHVQFGWGRAHAVVDIHVDGYSGNSVAHVIRDDFGLPANSLERLGIRLYQLCAPSMHAAGSDLGAGTCDIESIAANLFYQSEADRLLRKLRAGIATARAAMQAAKGKKEEVVHVK
jgi:hypothetical protein